MDILNRPRAAGKTTEWEMRRNVVIISNEKRGYDITAWGNNIKLTTTWKKQYNDAWNAAEIFANHYRDDTGQSLSIVLKLSPNYEKG
jgi:hypothetical protein